MCKQAQTATSPMDFAISVSNITKTFEQWQRGTDAKSMLKNLIRPQKRVITALDDVSFTIARGEFAAYAGANGAGKSTTMKLLCGMLLPKQGEISVLGLSPKKQRIALMRRLGVLFGNRCELWWDHPVKQSFEWKKVVWDIDDSTYHKTLSRLIEVLDLGSILNTFVRELSLGQRMKADLALMLLHAPEVILLDEPTIGLDVLAKRQMIGFLKDLNRTQGTTILVTSHDMDDLEEMAQRILLLSDGRIAFDGAFDALRQRAGGIHRAVLTADGQPPSIEGLSLLESSDNRHTYAMQEGMTMQKLLAHLATLPNVQDVQMQKAPIEGVIAGMYRDWQEKR